MSKKNLFVSVAVVLAAVVMMFAFTACISSDVDKVKEKLEEAGYTVIAQKANDLDEGIVGGLQAVKGKTSFSFTDLNIDGIYIYTFAKAGEAKKYYDENKDKFEKTAKIFKDGKSGVQGKVIYVGSPDAIKAAK
ncbi:MAG: hypothetical protein LBC13_03675 [Clostridiales bacterium]|jgi:hypothetical protein|nr:hypothetical protein [Clostridiales bacterium]